MRTHSLPKKGRDHKLEDFHPLKDFIFGSLRQKKVDHTTHLIIYSKLSLNLQVIRTFFEVRLQLLGSKVLLQT